MSQPQVKWGVVKRYFESRNYEIVPRGGDKIIKAPKGAAGVTRNTVLIGHEYSDHAGDCLAPGHLAKIKRAFGVSREDILAG
jgi:hypothetical protein